MITKNQIKELAEYYRIDEFTIFREYLQLVFLSYFYRHHKSIKIYFKGGTAIRLLLRSPRFSEDLDFSTEYSKAQIKEIVKEVMFDLKRELPEVQISTLYQGQKSVRFRLKYKSSDFKYPFTIRLDFTEKEKPYVKVSSPLVTKFPIIFPVVSHLGAEEILAEKVRALMMRCKGRDLFDLWFFLEKGFKLDASLVDKKLTEVGLVYDKEVLLDKIKKFSSKRLDLDLLKFLPPQYRRMVGSLKNRLLEALKGV